MTGAKYVAVCREKCFLRDFAAYRVACTGNPVKEDSGGIRENEPKDHFEGIRKQKEKSRGYFPLAQA